MFNINEKQIRNYVLYAIIFVVFVIIIWYIYNYLIYPRYNPSYVNNNEFHAGSDKVNEVTLMFFYADWCPHCKSAKGTDTEPGPWTSFKNKYDDKTINNTKIYIREIDCSKDEGTSKQMVEDYGVEGYPTIILIKGDEEIMYDAKPNEGNLEQFINSYTS